MERRPCDIDSGLPPVKGGCRWTLDVPGFYWWGGSPARDDRRDGFYSPMRRHVRDTLRAAVREYNAYGETDTTTDDRRSSPRHSLWSGGYWD